MGRHPNPAITKDTSVSRFRGWSLWLALFALLVQNIVPFSQALAIEPGSDVAYQIICTAGGVKQIPIGDDGEPVEPQGAEFCPFCFITSAPVYIEPVLEIAVQRVQLDDHVTVAIAPSTDLTSVWRAIPRPPRAPPFNV